VDLSGYNLLDYFRVPGRWWLPTKPEDKVPGTLTVNPEVGVRLELAGLFSSPEFDAHSLFSRPQSIRLDLVLGSDADSEVYTLHRLDALKLSSTSTFQVSYLLAGKHFHSVEEIVFRSAFVQYSYLAGCRKTLLLGGAAF